MRTSGTFVKGHKWFGVEGENHPNFKSEAGYASIHTFVKRIKHRPEKCVLCGKKARLDLMYMNHAAGVSNPKMYTRNPDDYVYACRACHMALDGRKNNLSRGCPSWVWTGRKHSEETKIKMSFLHKGKTASIETRRKMSLKRKGKPLSELHKQHLRGRVFSESHREKLRIAALKREAARRKNNGKQ